MRILLMSHYFPPEVNAPAVRSVEHARRWVRSGHDVDVITCFPHHPSGNVFPGYRLGWYQREILDGIRVHRVLTAVAPNKGTWRRSLDYVSYVPSAVWRAMRIEKPDVILATSPQFFVAVAGHLASRRLKVPWVMEVRDLWPESIAGVGAMRERSPAYRWTQWLEAKMYASARRIVCVTESFVGVLVARGIPESKLVYVPNGIDVALWRQVDGAGARRELGIAQGKKIISYVGTIGMAHGVGTILAAAERLRTRFPDLEFWIVGDGAEREELERRAREAKLGNVRFLGLLPRDEIPRILAVSDAALVLLKRREVFKTVLPSKMFEAMAAGKPVILGVEGEARRLLEKAGAGIAIAPESVDALCDAVHQIIANPDLAARWGRCGRTTVQEQFDRARWAAKLLKELESVVQGAGKGEMASDRGV